jgi:uncharacterized membrane protein YfcA
MTLQFLTGQDAYTLAAFVTAAFFAGIVRGYSGFGFSALLISTMSLMVPVVVVVPVALMLEVAASVQMVPSTISTADRRLVVPIIAGSIISVPFGQYLLLLLDPDNARLAVGLVVLSLVALITAGLRLERWRGTGFYVLTGVLSGCITGMVAMGGLFMTAMLLSTSLRIEVLRSTIVLLLFASALYALAIGIPNGLVTGHSVALSVLMLPAMAVGIIFGTRHFNPKHVKLYRRITLSLLTFLAFTGMIFSPDTGVEPENGSARHANVQVIHDV